jgi:DNA polymerase III subunit delta'
MKYNWSIIGHEKQLLQIEKDIETGNLAHAYLLSGPNSIGKSTVIKKMAGILQCENDFCHECKNCKQIARGGHPEVIELVDNKESIKIDEVRKIIESLSMTGHSKYRILLVQKLERMTLDAANSFLKILEEPPRKTIFLMTTDRLRFILPTITSRVRLVKFFSVSVGFLESKLKELFPDKDPDIISKASLFSTGRTGRAVRLMEKPESLLSHIQTYNEVSALLKSPNMANRFSYIDRIVDGEVSFDVFFDMLTHILRSRILEGDIETKKHLKALFKIHDTGILLSKNINPRLALENLMLNL